MNSALSLFLFRRSNSQAALSAPPPPPQELALPAEDEPQSVALPAVVVAQEVQPAPKATVVPLRPLATPGHIQFAASSVVCDLRVDSVDGRHRTTTYELVLANDAAVPVSGRLYGMDAKYGQRTFGALAVAANSVSRSMFTAPLDWRKDDVRVYMEVVGDGIHLLAEAQPPQHSATPAFASRPVLALCASIVLVLAASIAKLASAVGVASQPLVAMVVPHHPPPGIVNVAYAVQGRAQTTYRAVLSDGTVLSSGTLSAPSGDIPITVPASAAGRVVRVSLEASGPLGHAVRSGTFAVAQAAPTAESSARILSLTAHRETYAGGQSVLASYSAVGSGGTLRILTAQGTVVASAPFTHVGTSRLVIGNNAANQSLRAELEVSQGRSHASAAVELPAQIDPKAEAAKILALRAAAGDLGGDPTLQNAQSIDTSGPAMQDAGSTALPNDPFFVQQRVVSGGSFQVAIRKSMPHMHIELQDEMGSVLDDRTVAAGETSITLAAPKTSIVQTYYLAGTFVRDSLEETIVRSLRVFPN